MHVRFRILEIKALLLMDTLNYESSKIHNKVQKLQTSSDAEEGKKNLKIYVCICN